MSINICGIGVVSAIGIGCEENFQSLYNQRCGIGDEMPFDTSLNLPVGALKYSNDELKTLLSISQNKVISRTALIGALAAKEAIVDAQIEEGKRIGLISSTTVGGMDLSELFYRDYINNPNDGDLDYVKGHDCAESTEFIANYCKINNFRTTISTACSSAANAIMMGAEMLKRGMLDYVIAGGTDAMCAFTLNGFNSLKILSDELCKPFDKDRKGLNLGEGAGYVVLTKDRNCKKNYCQLTGYANTNDAYHQTASSENGEGAFMAMTSALQMAQLSSQDIDYINLHGTGTNNNDKSESIAVKRVFGENIPRCSSTKCYTGHTLAAAGGVEAVYSVLSIQNNIRYANIRFEQCDEHTLEPIIHNDEDVTIHHVLSNSFGFGGNCSSLIFSKE